MLGRGLGDLHMQSIELVLLPELLQLLFNVSIVHISCLCIPQQCIDYEGTQLYDEA